VDTADVMPKARESWRRRHSGVQGTATVVPGTHGTLSAWPPHAHCASTRPSHGTSSIVGQAGLLVTWQARGHG
jgi:hypothetical protein